MVPELPATPFSSPWDHKRESGSLSTGESTNHLFRRQFYGLVVGVAGSAEARALVFWGY
jgi:hypothetical protein